jgi:formylglycine-generating enzyme required for sulfatase activity
MNEPIKVFLSYSHKDDELKKEFCDHLAVLQHNQLIAAWQDRNIDAGSEWADAIHQNLEQAEIILLLVSSAFLASRYCYSIEMQQALKRHKSGSAKVIPVIIRDSPWTTSPLGQLQAVPRDNRAVATWGDQFARDTAWRLVTEEITKVVQGMIDRRQSESMAVQKANAIQTFRAKAEDFYKDGVLSPGERALLDIERKRLGLDELEAEAILGAVKSAYQQHQADLECYRQTLIDEWAGQDELRTDQCELLQQLQTGLVISDPEVEQIRQAVLAERARERQTAQEAADKQAQEAERQQQQETEALLNQEAAEQQRTLEAQRQQSAENFQRKQDLEATEQRRQDAATRYANLNLQTFSFEVVLLDDAGKKRKRTTEQAQYFAEVLAPGINLPMVLIPGGSFQMGSSDGEVSDDERPQHLVTVAPLFMGKFPVTQAQWRVVADYPQVKQALSTKPSRFEGDNLPVEKVSWHNAMEFCARLSRKMNRTYRLPSEAEWEYACRAKTYTPYHFGREISQGFLNNTNARKTSFLSKSLPSQTSEVGSFGVANTFGLYDMHGNVWEWCLDLWHKNYAGAPQDGSAWVHDNDNNHRLLRGGSWFSHPDLCRSSFRAAYSPGSRDVTVGFRVVLVPS